MTAEFQILEFIFPSIGRYLEQPSGEFGVPPKFLQVLVGRRKYLLCQIVGLLSVSNESVGEVIDFLIVFFNQKIERLPITPDRPLNSVSIPVASQVRLLRTELDLQN